MNRTILLALVMTGCTNKSETADDLRGPLLEAWTETIILPLYEDFQTQADVLNRETTNLCSEFSEEQLATVKSQWWAVRSPWKRAEVFAFGPFKEEPLRIGPKIDFWPARTDDIEEMLTGDTDLSGDAVQSFGATLTGMPVIEYLLYEVEEEAAVAFANDARRCLFLTGLTSDLLFHAEQMNEAWQPDGGNYADASINAGENTEAFDSQQESFSEVVNSMGFTIENIRNDKLGRPFGNSTGGNIQADKAESAFSGRSLTDIQDNLWGIKALYWGIVDEDAMGLEDALLATGKDLTDESIERFNAADAAVFDIPEPLTASVNNEEQSIQTAIDILGELQRHIQVDVANALAISVSFNDTDGD